jgi:branched-chain amino acid transport system substrate-binding protein
MKPYVARVPLFVAVLILFFTGCQSQQSDESGGPLEIGAILPLTGDNANYGKAARRGIDLAVKEINESGGVNGRELEPVYQDTKAATRAGVNVTQQLVNVRGVPAIIGGIVSGVTLAAAQVAERNEVVLISPTASSPDLTDAGEYIFRNFPSDNLEGRVMANFMSERGVEKAAIVQLRNDYGAGVASVFKKAFEQQGGDVVVHERYSEDATQFRPISEKVQAANPDAIYVIGYYAGAARLIQETRETGIDEQVFATTTVEDPQFTEIGGEAVEGVIYPLASGYDEDSQQPAVQRFNEGFQEMHGEAPGFVAAQAYDCVYLIKRAIEKGGGVTGPAIQSGMAQIKGFEGATGTITFDAKGNIQKNLTMKVVRDGEFTVLEEGVSAPALASPASAE